LAAREPDKKTKEPKNQNIAGWSQSYLYSSWRCVVMVRSVNCRLLLLTAAVAVVGCGANLESAGQSENASQPESTEQKAAPRIGQSAPAFSVADTDGQVRSLADFRGQPLVLEWTNLDCSYVAKHYDSGNMQMQQRKAREDFDAAWLTVITGPRTFQAVAEEMEQVEATPTAVLIDESGDMARAYDVSVTPHLYIIDAEGILRYMGGIDSKPGEDPEDIEGATQFVLLGLDRLTGGHPVVEPITRPYGCSLGSN
jgi:peroxiredoxin